jgi:hypothetical protein
LQFFLQLLSELDSSSRHVGNRRPEDLQEIVGCLLVLSLKTSISRQAKVKR